MTLNKTLLLAGALSALSASAFAQAPAQPQGQPLGGPVIAGVCLLSREAVFANAKVSVAANTRLQQLAQQAQAEVDAQRTPLEAELAAYQAEAPRLQPAQREAREQALAAKLQPVQVKTAQRTREIEATRAKAFERIANEAQPVIADVYKKHNCGLLVDRNSVLGGNFANDLTAEVVTGLDARIQTISFERENLPATAAAQ